MSNYADEYLTMIEDCEARESRLTEWEAEFLESISSWLAKDRALTEKQTETLERIWEMVTANG